MTRSRIVLILVLIAMGMSGCSNEELRIREKLRPVRKLLNKKRSYWTDKVQYKGEPGTEIVYYMNGRPAMEKIYNISGLLESITYIGRNGAPLRKDSLVYAGEELIAGYYFSEPEHQIQLKFLSYKQQGQLSQRSWFGQDDELLGREFFLFDTRGKRRMRMIFDGNDSLLYTETFRPGSDELQLQNTYDLHGDLVEQTVHEMNKPSYRYSFNSQGQITRISQLLPSGELAWSSDLQYSSDQVMQRSNFSVNGRYLFTHTGDLELLQQSAQTWRHPFAPSQRQRVVQYQHTDPFVSEKRVSPSGDRLIDYRLPKSGALFKRTRYDQEGISVRDTIFSSQGGTWPVAVRAFGPTGQLVTETSYDLSGDPRWVHKYFRDSENRVIREEITALPDTFAAAVTRFYDAFGQPALSERFSSPDTFDGTWVFYHGGGINQTFFYTNAYELDHTLLLRPSGDTTRHSTFTTIDYIRVESKYGMHDTLLSQHRFTSDGILSWEIFFDRHGRLSGEVHRKRDGSIYREVRYNHEDQSIISSTYAPRGFDDSPSFHGDRGELTSRVESKLNPQGERIQVISYNSSGERDWEKRYAYRDGKLLKSAQLDAEGKPVVISSYNHDEQGRVLTEEALDKDGQRMHLVENQYDENGQLIWTTFNSPLSGMDNANRFYYDDQQRLQRNEIISNKRFIEAVEYEYFPEFYLRLATHYSPEGELIRKEIENYFGDNVFNIGSNKE